MIRLAIAFLLCSAVPAAAGIIASSAPIGVVFDNGGQPWTWANRVQAEAFDVGGHNLANTCGIGTFTQLGADRVDVEPTTDLDQSTLTVPNLKVSCLPNNTFLNYSVMVPTPGPFTMNMRVSSSEGGAVWQVLVDGVPVTTLTVPNTGPSTPTIVNKNQDNGVPTGVNITEQDTTLPSLSVGNTVILSASWCNGNGPNDCSDNTVANTLTVTDSAGNTIGSALVNKQGCPFGGTAFKFNVTKASTSTDTFRVVFANAVSFPHVNIVQIAGLDASSTIDGSPSAVCSTNGTLTLPYSTTINGSLIYSAIGTFTATGVGSSQTIINGGLNGGPNANGAVDSYDIETTAGSHSQSWNFTGAAATGVVLAIKPGVGSDNFQTIQSPTFNIDVGNHLIKFINNGGSADGFAGDFNWWQAVTPPQQVIASVGVSPTSFATPSTVGEAVGAVTVTMSPPTPSFSGVLTLTGADAAKFIIPVGGSNPTLTLTNGPPNLTQGLMPAGVAANTPVSDVYADAPNNIPFSGTFSITNGPFVVTTATNCGSAGNITCGHITTSRAGLSGVQSGTVTSSQGGSQNFTINFASGTAVACGTSATVQAASTSAGNGATLLFPACTYTWSSGVSPVSNQTWIGVPGQTIFDAGGNNPAVSPCGFNNGYMLCGYGVATGVTVANITLQNDGTNFTQANLCGGGGFPACSQFGNMVSTDDGWVLQNNTLLNTLNAAVVTSFHTGTVSVINNYFHHIGSGAAWGSTGITGGTINEIGNEFGDMNFTPVSACNGSGNKFLLDNFTLNYKYNYHHDVKGPALWADSFINQHYNVNGNSFVRIGTDGVLLEQQHSEIADVSFNVFDSNGDGSAATAEDPACGGEAQAWQAFRIDGSANANFHDNNISVRTVTKSGGPFYFSDEIGNGAGSVVNNVAQNNTVNFYYGSNTDPFGAWGWNTTTESTTGSASSGNHYHLSGGNITNDVHWYWLNQGNSPKTFAGYQASGQDASATIDTAPVTANGCLHVACAQNPVGNGGIPPVGGQPNTLQVAQAGVGPGTYNVNICANQTGMQQKCQAFAIAGQSPGLTPPPAATAGCATNSDPCFQVNALNADFTTGSTSGQTSVCLNCGKYDEFVNPNCAQGAPSPCPGYQWYPQSPSELNASAPQTLTYPFTDGANGTVLRITGGLSVSGDQHGRTGISTRSTLDTYGTDYPFNAYLEIVERLDADCIAQACWHNFASYDPNVGKGNEDSFLNMEFDLGGEFHGTRFQNGNGFSGGTAYNTAGELNWTCSNNLVSAGSPGCQWGDICSTLPTASGVCDIRSSNGLSAFDPTQYHKYAWLSYQTDANHFQGCFFIDDQPVPSLAQGGNCGTFQSSNVLFTIDNNSSQGNNSSSAFCANPAAFTSCYQSFQRLNPMTTLTSGCNYGSEGIFSCDVPGSTYHMYVKSVRVWTCPTWASPTGQKSQCSRFNPN